MPMTFACKACGRTVRVTRKAQGQWGACPHCRVESIVPTLPAEHVAETASADDQPLVHSISGASAVEVEAVAAAPAVEAAPLATAVAPAVEAAPLATAPVVEAAHMAVLPPATPVTPPVDMSAAQLELERQKLALERERLLFEREKLAMERIATAQALSAPAAAPARTTSSRVTKRTGVRPSSSIPRERRPTSPSLVIGGAAALGVVVGIVIYAAGPAPTAQPPAKQAADGPAPPAPEVGDDPPPPPAPRPDPAAEARRAAEAARVAEQRRATEEVASLRASIDGVRRRFGSRCTAREFVELKTTLDRLEREAAGRLPEPIAEARAAERFCRPLAAINGMDEARALARLKQWPRAHEAFTLAESIGLEVTPGLKAERDHWVQEQQAEERARAASASAAAAAADAPPVEAPRGPDLLPWRAAGRRAELLGRGGGTQATEAAVNAGLRWLARHQSPDGGWSAQHALRCAGRRPCSGPGVEQFDVGVSGLAVLAFLGAGHGPRSATAYEDPHAGKRFDYGEVVRAGIARLIAGQDPGGCLARRRGEYLYDHAIATLALAEACALSGDPAYRAPAEKAVAFLLAMRNEGLGWRYTQRPGDNDTSCTGWAIQALDAARRAGIDVPDEPFDGARAWLDRVTDPAGVVGYTAMGSVDVFVPGKNEAWGSHPTMTALGALMRLAFGADPKDPLLAKAEAHLLADKPRWDEGNHTIDLYYWHHATCAMFQLDDGAAAWRPWNEALKAALLPHQAERADGCAEGSWDPAVDRWGYAGGRVYATAMNALTLEVYYRHERVPPKPPQAGPGARAGVEADVRRRFAAWVRVRAAGVLRCDVCAGAGTIACSRCGGDRMNDVQTPGQLERRLCDACTDGTERCKDGQCLEGYNTQSLRTAFWDPLSEVGRRGRTAQALQTQLVRGELDDLVGPSLVIRSAEVTSVNVAADRVRVTATVTWGDDRTSTWVSTWVRYGGRWSLATAADTRPDALR